MLDRQTAERCHSIDDVDRCHPANRAIETRDRQQTAIGGLDDSKPILDFDHNSEAGSRSHSAGRLSCDNKLIGHVERR